MQAYPNSDAKRDLSRSLWQVRRRFFLAIALALLVSGIAPINAHENTRRPQAENSMAATGNGELAEIRERLRQIESRLSPQQRGETPLVDELIPSNSIPRKAPCNSPSFLPAGFVDSVVSDKSSLKLGGYVKLDLIHDFNAIGSTDAFDPLTIPTDGRGGENTRLHARQTRLNLEFLPNSSCEELRLFVEGDFFGSTDPFRRGRDFFRLRHAFVRAGRLLAGQTWSTFMDETILPATLDFESPRSVILDRRAILRWTQPLTDSLAFAFAVEDPRPVFDLGSAPSGDVDRPAPDLIARFRYERLRWHLQSAGVVRLLRYRESTGGKDDEAGWGFNFTGRFRPIECNSVLFQVAFGEGIEGYRQAPDAAVDANGTIELIPLIAWVVGYEVDWTDQLSSTLVYSAGRGTNTAFQLADAPQAAEYVAANIIYAPLPRLSYGLEYLYGTRTDRDDAKGEAHRVQFSVRYDLP